MRCPPRADLVVTLQLLVFGSFGLRRKNRHLATEDLVSVSS
jgi:hypothetical protein